MSAEITKYGILDMQVCVPAEWTDAQVEEWANRENQCGTTHGWQIRRQGSELLAGADERVPCAQMPGRVHIMLNA